MYSEFAMMPNVVAPALIDDEPDFLDELIERFSVDDPDLRPMVEALADAHVMVRELAREREQAGMTQEQMAQRLRTTKAAIARFERAEGLPSLERLVEYATVIGRRITLA